MQPTGSWRSVMGLVSLLFTACAGGTPAATTADPIRIVRAPPPPGAQPLGTLRAVDGEGCGLFGTKGTYEGASAKLRAQAQALGADYVQITDVTEPHAEHECVRKEYVLSGIAFRTSPRAPAVAPAAASAATPANSSTASGAPPSSTCTTVRTLEFSARSAGNTAFGVWLDQTPNDAATGLELRYEPNVRELALVRYPGAKHVAVADDPLDLGTDWHRWRLERSHDQIAVRLDDKLVLLHAAPAPSTDANFGLDAAGVELRGMRLGCAGDMTH